MLTFCPDLAALREKHKSIRESAKVFKNPFLTLFYFITKVIPSKIAQLGSFLATHITLLLLGIFFVAGYAALNFVDNPFQSVRC